ncbi:MAG: trypsin-like peptidase domain-containing protein [Chloroflexota bacterium]|nr:trypsin-like peptidase domain-containing protein [Chloroflexota bacterium]
MDQVPGKRYGGSVAIIALLIATLIVTVVMAIPAIDGLPAQASTVSDVFVQQPPVRAGVSAAATRPADQTLPPDLAAALTLVEAQERVLTNIYETVLPSVVHIQVRQRIDRENLGGFAVPGLPFGGPDDPDTPGDDFFRGGEGSGFVWDDAGHIVTNNHVVENAVEVRVFFSNGFEAEAEVLGKDADADLAVISIDVDSDQLVPVVLGNSGNLRVGQLAVAIGNPFGLENTMTFGIISALGRTINSGRTPFSIPEVVQTDAPINPGNSGGPLLDRFGRVIGINTQIVSRSGSNSGIGFAVPIDIAKRIVPELIEDGDYEYSWLGITGQTLRSEVVEANDLSPDTRGALVVALAGGGPADQAGLVGSQNRQIEDALPYPVGGDVIVAIADQPVTGMDDLITYLASQTQPGDVVTLEVIRDGETISLDVELGARPGVMEVRNQFQDDGEK